jgi:Hydrazine synthase alpha subunit middle domain
VRARAIAVRLSSPLILAGIIMAGIIGFGPAFSVLSSGPESPAFLFTAAKRYEPLAWARGADRFSSDANIFLQNANGRRRLIPRFAASADPAVSFDGRSALFAGKRKAEDHWQIWEVALDATTPGAPPRRVTKCAEDCVRPFYLPGERIVYAKKSAGRFVIEAADRASGQIVQKTVQLTYGPGNFLPTDVLRDGRILFEATYPLGTKGTPELYTVYSDGSGVESYRCDHGQARYSGKQAASGDIVFASSLGLARFTSARAEEVRIPAPVGEYAGDIAETSSGDWLLAWRNRKTPFQLMWWRPGAGTLRPVAAESDSNSNSDVIQPTLIVARTVPKRHPSGLHDWPNANLLCLNAYTSKYRFAAGSIHSVRLYTRDSAGSAKLLGAAPVERDGSFFLQVPADQPLQIELLDSSRKTLKRQAGWFWMRRGEQRACVGCHAGPETAPENAVPMILLKSTTPADMTGTSTQVSAGGH